MLKIMRGLEIAATAIVSAAALPFLAAWDAKGLGPDRYRETVEKLYRTTVAVLTFVAGILCATAARAAAVADPKPGTQPGRHPRSYLYRRSYRGRHYTGTPLHMLLTTKELAVAVAT